MAGKEPMKREKAAKRLDELADRMELIAEAHTESGDFKAADAYAHAARMTRREAYKIKEKL